MMMPGRSYSAQNGYRYGFNGKENDNEVKGEGNQIDYGKRVYDTRLGRFLSLDPLQRRYPELTPYQYASNSPIAFIDLDGLERYYYKLNIDSRTGESTLTHSATEEREGTLLDALLFRSPSGAKITTKDIYVNVDVDGSYNQTLHFNYFSQLNDWKVKGMPVDKGAGNSEQAAMKAESNVAVVQMMMLTLEQKIDEADGDYDGYAQPSTNGGQSTTASTNKQATAANNGIKEEAPLKLKGSGSVSGVIELNSNIKSSKAFVNGLSQKARDFVYDPTTEKFAMAGNNFEGMKHYGLRKVIGASENNVVGGRIKLGANGEILTSQWSGTYGHNWTPEIAQKFKTFMESTIGKKINDSHTTKFADGKE